MKRGVVALLAFAAGAGIMLLAAQPRRPVVGNPPVTVPEPPPAPRAPDRNPERARELAELAHERLKQGDAKEAEALLDEALRADASHPSVAFVRGRLSLARGEHAAARRHFEDALVRQDSEETHGDLADALFMLGEYAGAIEHATKGKRLFTRASAYAKLGMNDQALRDWVQHTKEHPADAAAWRNRGNHEMRMGLRGHAVASWEQAVAIDRSMKAELDPLIEAARE